MRYEVLLDEATDDNVYIIENARFNSRADGLINGNIIGINRDIRSHRERTCVLAEELGHFYTTTGDILDQSEIENRKQELKARMWAYDKLIGLDGILRAYEHGCESLYETAEFLDVTEEFLLDALKQYRSKYGTQVRVGKYEISFDPILKVKDIQQG